MSPAQKTAARDRAASTYLVYPGTVGATPIPVSTYTEAVKLAHETNGNWSRV